jgi:hypothetical protein
MLRWRPLALPFAAGPAAASQSIPAAADSLTVLAEVMVVGSNHLANSNRDMVNLPVEDVLTSRRQREIQDVVDGLAQWRPTRIAVEWPHDDETGLDRRYAEYRAGRLERTASELDQIALRLAKKLGLSKVHAVDWNHEGPGDPADYDFTEWARTNGDGHRLQNLIERARRGGAYRVKHAPSDCQRMVAKS